MLACVIGRITACRPAQKGAYFFKSMRIECRQRFQLTPRCWNAELARECSDICKVKVHLCAYMQKAPNSEH